jgi:regulator of protease activity HflC (stomatin/prohibitin superfamily)
MGLETLIIGGIIAAALGSSSIKVNREYERGVIFRLGRSSGVRGAGLYLLFPVIDQMVQVDIRTKTINIEPQEAVTADNVTIKVNAVLYYRILDPNKAINQVENYQMAVYQGAMTTLRNVVGQNNLDEVLQNRDQINQKVQEIVDDMTERWGVVIERVEMKDVEIPIGMQRAMAKEAEAIREKRARIIKAAAEQEASVKLSEAAKLIADNPVALELRRLQMLTEVGAENNTTTIVMIPSELLNMASRLGQSGAVEQVVAQLKPNTNGQAPNGQAAIEPGAQVALPAAAPVPSHVKQQPS